MNRHRGSRGVALVSTLVAAVMGGCAASDAPLVGADAGGAAPLTPTPAPVASAASRPSEPAFAPGQIVVKFKSSGQASVTEDVRAWLAQGRSFITATADGSPSLDLRVKRHGIFAASSLLRGREGLATHTAKLWLHSLAKPHALNFARRASPPPEDLVNVYRLDLPDGADLQAAIEDLRNDPHVEYAHPNYLAHVVYTPNDPYLASQGTWGQPRADLWNIQSIHAPQAWDATRGAGVVVAVVDTGVDIRHPDLAGNIWTNSGEIPDNGVDDDANGYVDDVHGWSVLWDSNEADDQVGHGTHVAGTIAAQDNNGMGVVGVAPDAQIMPVQVFSFRTAADVFTLSQGILYAAHNGADVINNSWEVCQTGCPSSPVVEDAVRAAHNAGSVVVFAAGNQATDIRDQSPQNQAEVIVVSATTPSDTRAAFSNFGLVDLAAPGSGELNDPGVSEPDYGILSLRAASCVEPWICGGDRNVGDAYVRLAGTSMAAPHVAGAAALILALHPTYSPEQVRQVLRRTSVDSNANGYDPDLGYGRLDTALLASEPTPLEALIQLPVLVQASPLTITGSANGAQFSKYVLEYGAGTAPTSWTQVSTSTTSVRAGALGIWDAARLADGTYTFRLTAHKSTGAKYEDLHQLTLDRVAITQPTSTSLVRGGDVSITGMASPGTFKSYAIRIQVLETGAAVNANVSLPNGGRQPVANGVLGVWHTQGLRAGHYRILLDVTNTNNSVTTENVIVMVDPLVHAGWPVDLTFQDKFVGPPTGPATVADVQGDAAAEIITGWGNQVTVLRGDGSAAPGWPQSVATVDSPWTWVTSMPVVGDIDGDGTKDIVVAATSGLVFVWNANGTLKSGWPRTVSNDTLSLSLADVDSNGVLDILATDPQTGVYVLRGNGSTLPGWPVLLGYGIRGPATVADLNQDGKNEVVVALDSAPAQLFVYSDKGILKAGWPQILLDTGYESFGSHPVVGDMDDDGDLEIVAVASDLTNTSASKVAIYQHTGQVLRAWSPNALSVAPPVLADLDGDGSLEILSSIVKSDSTGAATVWDRNGNALPGWPRAAPANPPLSGVAFSAPIVFDLDGDGRSEVITSRQAEYYSSDLDHNYGYPVQAFRYNGTPIADLARPAYGAWPYADASPAVADTDGDGRLELVWTEIRNGSFGADPPWPRVFTWDLTASASNARSWPMYRSDARHSGVAQAVVPLVRLTQRNTVRRVNGLSRFVFRSGSSGQVQLKHVWNAAVKYAVGNDVLKPTTLGWGQQFTVPPNQDIKLRVVTTAPIDVTIDWW